jgi:hypothetical protein
MTLKEKIDVLARVRKEHPESEKTVLAIIDLELEDSLRKWQQEKLFDLWVEIGYFDSLVTA